MGFLSFLYDLDPIEGPVPVSFPSFGAREEEREGRRRRGGETEEGFVRSQLCREKKERSVCVCIVFVLCVLCRQSDNNHFHLSLSSVFL